MTKLTTVALFFLAAGYFTSVSILSVYQVLFAIPLAYYCYLAIKNKQIKLPVSAWFLIAFTAIALLSLVINYEYIPKPSKNFGRLKYFVYGIAGIFVFRVWLKEVSDKAKSILTYTFFLSIVVAACYAMYNLTISIDGRAKGLTDTMRYGYGSAMILLMMLSMILHHKNFEKWFNWKIAIGIFVVGFVGMYITYTRGALLGFLCGIPFVLYFYKPKLGLTLGGLAVAAVLGLVGVYLFGSGNYQSRFLVSKNNGSDHIRRSQWKAAIIATKEKPVLGWGLSNFHSQLKRIKNDYDLDAKEYNDAHAHNLFLEIAAGTGVVGLLAFLGWLVSWAIEAFRAKGMYRALIVPFGVAFVVSSQFEVTFDANNASMIFFLYALSASSEFFSRPMEPHSQS